MSTISAMRREIWLTVFVLGLVAGCSSGSHSICTSGQSRCIGQLVEVCRDNTWQVSEDCALSGKICQLEADQAVCRQPVECQEGEQRCQQNRAEKCSGGAWQLLEDCALSEKSCQIDAVNKTAFCKAAADCQAGQSRCLENVVELCQDGVWQTVQDCAQQGRICRQSGDSAECIEPPCTEGSTICQGKLLLSCSGGQWQVLQDCAVDHGWCEKRAEQAACRRLSWRHLEITIQDPVMQGTSLMLPIDGPTFGYAAAERTMVTSFGHDVNQPTLAFLWQLDELNGIHRKLMLSGEVLAEGVNFCDGQNWCQMISFDPRLLEWVVVGPSAPSLMRVSQEGVSRLTAMSGTRQPDRYIDRIHYFDWSGRRLWLYGAVGPSSFSTALYHLDLDSGLWTKQQSGLMPVCGNCLVVDGRRALAYSFGGSTSTDGGNTSQPLDSYLVITLDGGATEQVPFPQELGQREGQACAIDPGRDLVYIFGGALVRDSYNEVENEYHNDLWAMRLSDGAWFELSANKPGGVFTEPDQYGNRHFDAFPEGPNFGKNRGYMLYDAELDRLLVVGEVPIFHHGQLYVMELAGVENLLGANP